MSGIFDRISNAASDARDAVSDAASAATDAVTDTASAVTDTVSEAASSAVDTAQSTAAAAQAQLDSFTRDAGAVAREAVTDVGAAAGSVVNTAQGVVRDAAGRVEAQGRALAGAAEELGDRASATVRTGLSQAGGAAREAAEGLSRLERNVATGVRDLGRTIEVAGREGVRAAEEGLRDLGERAEGAVRGFERGAREILEDARDTAGQILSEGERLAGMVGEQLDPAAHIGRLDSEGDSVSIHLGGFAQAEVRVAGEGELEVERCEEPPGGYNMSVGGSIGVGVVGQLGGSAGAEASAEANAMLNAGGTVQMHFNTREEAERAVRISARMAAVGAAGAAGGPLGTLTAGAAGLAIGPSEDDMRFMSEHTRSVEIRGSLAGEISAEAGIAETLDAGVEGSAHADVGVRLTFAGPDDEGRMRGPRLTVINEIGFEASGNAAAGIGVSGSVSGSARLETEIELPPGIPPEDLLRDPRGTLSRIRGQGGLPSETTLTIEGEASGGGTAGALYAEAGASAGGSFEVSARGDPRQLLAAARAAARGDVNGALGTLDRNTTLKAEVTSFTNTGVSFSPELTAFGVGAGVEAQYQFHNEGEPVEIEWRPSEVAARLREQLQRATGGGRELGRPKTRRVGSAAPSFGRSLLSRSCRTSWNPRPAASGNLGRP